MQILLSQEPVSLAVNLGAPVIGSYVNAILYGISMLCVYIYTRSKRAATDSRFVKFAVAACAVLDTVATFMVCGNVFYLTVLRWGYFNRDFRNHWTAVTWFLSTIWTEFIVQAFMVRRYFLLSRHYFVSAVIILLMIFSLERNMFIGISNAIGSLPARQRPTQTLPILLALGAAVGANFVTMIAMFWKLKVTNTYNRVTHNVVRCICAMVVITGTATCLISIAIIVTFLVRPLSSLSTCFSYFAGRVYSLTLLFTLLYRDMMKNDQWFQIDGATDDLTTSLVCAPSGAPDSLPVARPPGSDMTCTPRAVEEGQNGPA